MNGYRVPHGYRVAISPYPPPYPRPDGIPYIGVEAVMTITMNTAPLVSPADDASITIDVGQTFNDLVGSPGGPYTAVRLIWDAGSDGTATPAIPGVADVVIGAVGITGISTNADVVQLVADEINAQKASLGYPFSAVADTNDLVLTWDYPSPLPNDGAHISDTDGVWPITDANAAFAGGVDPQACLPGILGPHLVLLPTITGSDAYGYS